MKRVEISVSRDDAIRIAVLVEGQIRQVDDQIAAELENNNDNSRMVKLRLDSLYRDKMMLQGLVDSVRQALRWFDGPD